MLQAPQSPTIHEAPVGTLVGRMVGRLVCLGVGRVVGDGVGDFEGEIEGHFVGRWVGSAAAVVKDLSKREKGKGGKEGQKIK